MTKYILSAMLVTVLAAFGSQAANAQQQTGNLSGTVTETESTDEPIDLCVYQAKDSWMLQAVLQEEVGGYLERDAGLPDGLTYISATPLDKTCEEDVRAEDEIIGGWGNDWIAGGTGRD